MFFIGWILVVKSDKTKGDEMPHKIAIFDNSWSGEYYLDFLKSEYGIYNIDRLIDWKSPPYHQQTALQIKKSAITNIGKYVKKYDTIIIVNQEISLYAIDDLKKFFPNQIFITAPILLDHVKTIKQQKITVLTSRKVINSPKYKNIYLSRRELAKYTFIDCNDWIEKDHIKNLTDTDINQKIPLNSAPDLILIESSNLIPITDRLSEHFNWRSQVVDNKLLLAIDIMRTANIRYDYSKKLPSVFRKVRGRE